MDDQIVDTDDTVIAEDGMVDPFYQFLIRRHTQQGVGGFNDQADTREDDEGGHQDAQIPHPIASW